MKNYKNIITVLLTILFSVQLNAEGDQKNKTNKLNKTNGEPEWTKFNINNLSTWIYNNGFSDINENGNSGFVYPKGSNKACFFKSGLVWGGKVNGKIRVGGSTYNSGLSPGRILRSNQHEDTSNVNVRIYKVRTDYKTTDFDDELEYVYKNEFIDSLNYITKFKPLYEVEELKSQYEIDWREWPAESGAPYNDIDKNGIYEPSIDIPGVPGADQTIWYVANDLDETKTLDLYGSPPIGIEMQATIWGYKSSSPVGNMLFRKYKIINKSNYEIDSMYLSMWSDPDLGDATDDLVGYDSTLSLMYVYNSSSYDGTYKQYSPSAGFKFLHGPLVNSDDNSYGIFNNEKIFGKENLEISSFAFFIGADPVYSDPNLRDYNEGTLEMYNLMQGLIGTTGEPFVAPLQAGGEKTKFALSGDPIKKTGWIDGMLHSPGDRRLLGSYGPFTLAINDTQEIIVAQIAAGGTEKIDRLEAVKLLRYYSHFAEELYNNGFELSRVTSEIIPEVNLLNEGTYGNIRLSWDNEYNKNRIEKFEQNGYKFQGYNLYQLHFNDSFLIDEKQEIVATFDMKDGIKNIEGIVANDESGYAEVGIAQYANDNGIKREFIIEKDYFTDLQLAKGKKYFFGLVAYFYNELENKIYKTPKGIVEFVYKEFYEGLEFQDSIFVKGNLKSSSGIIFGTVAVPDLLTGDEYKIEFEESNNKVSWNLYNHTTNQYLLRNQDVISYPDFRNREININQPIVDGIQFNVIAPDPEKVKIGGMIEVAYAGGSIPESAWDSLGREFGGNSVLNDENWDLNGTRDKYKIRYDVSFKGYYDWQGKNYRDFEIRFTENENFGFGYYSYDSVLVIKVPFEVWDIGVNTINDKSDDVRMIPGIRHYLEENINLKINFEYVNGERCSNIIYFYDPETNEGYSHFEENAKAAGGEGTRYPYNNDGSNSGLWINKTGIIGIYGSEVLDYIRFCDLDNDGKWPESGTVIRILTEKPYKSGESYSFKAPSSNSIPNNYKLFQNYPNPFNPTTTIRFFIPTDSFVKLDIFNILGQKVETILNEKLLAGFYEKKVDGKNLSSGVYFYKLETDTNFSEIKKMVLLK